MDHILTVTNDLFETGKPFAERFIQFIQHFKHEFNSYCANRLEPIQLIFLVIAVLWLVSKVHFIFRPDLNDDRWSVFKRLTVRLLMKLPIIGKYAKEKIADSYSAMEDELMKPYKNETFRYKLPGTGFDDKEVLKFVKEYSDLGQIRYDQGMASGSVYANINDEKYVRMLSDVFSKTVFTNPLHMDIFPGIRKMEAEVVRMSCTVFNGDKDSCGSVSTGGTESIFLAVKAFRDYARFEKGIDLPEIIAPITVHAAFDKSAKILRMKIHHVPVDKRTLKVDISAMKKLINKNTCLLVGSAPGFPHGIIDDIDEICELGLKYGIPVHMDCCLGGFLLPFVNEAGFEVPQFDFRLPGLCAISADTHKYGQAPKGSSVVLYSDIKYQRYQFWVVTEWPGGLYASPTLSGSRSGANIATCWAAMVYNGQDGYVNAARKIINTSRFIRDELKTIEGIFIFGDPLLSVIAIGSRRISIFRLFERLTLNGWSLNSLQFPSGFHLCVTLMHTTPGIAERFIKDVRRFVAQILKEPKSLKDDSFSAAVYGMSQSVPDRSLVGNFALKFLECYYQTEIPKSIKVTKLHNGKGS